MSTVAQDIALDVPPAALVFTESAARKVGSLIESEGNPNLKLRVFVQGGGCSGLQYGFEFDEEVQDGDTCVENLGVSLLVDPMSFQYLSGAEIDYREGLEGVGDQDAHGGPQASSVGRRRRSRAISVAAAYGLRRASGPRCGTCVPRAPTPKNDAFTRCPGTGTALMGACG